MHRSVAFTLILAVMLCGGAGVAHSEQAAGLDPGTMAALQKMGAYLRSLKAFQVEATTTDEDVLEDGQKVQYSGVATVLAREPDRLRAEVTDPHIKRLYLYDGKNFTLFGERVGYYATVAAPATIAQLADKLDTDYGFSVPLADLFRWGAKGWSSTAIKRALDLGPSEVNGVTCEQYALRQDDVDWQVWIQKGDYPLPLKLVITTRTDEARPQHSVVYVWNLAPSFNEAAFKFDPPAQAQRVVLRDGKFEVAAAPAPAAKK